MGIYISFEWDDEQSAEAGGWDGGAPEALRLQHKHFTISNPSIQRDTLIICLFFALFCLSLALDAVIALLMRGHMGDIWSLPLRRKHARGTTSLCVCVCVYARA